MKLLPCLFALFVASATLSAAPVRLLLVGEKKAASALAALLAPRTELVVSPEFPDGDAPLDKAEVLVLAADDYGPLLETHRAALEKFAARGGGVLAVHGAVGAGEAAWLKPLLGGAWIEGKSQRFTSKAMLYVATDQHPIVAGASPFDLTDETAYDLELDPAVKVLASAFTPKLAGVRENRRGRAEKNALPDRANIYDLQPQLWAFEGAKHRAVVALPAAPETLRHASYVTFLLRSVAWVAHRANLDELVKPEELAALRYPAGGPETPEATVKQFQLHPDFTATVVAAEPLINKPIAMQWDARGRLWVAETPEYPNGRRPAVTDTWKETGVLDPQNPDRPARDRISILSAPDASGRFTKKAVFYEGLELVTGFCLYKDGVIALHEPDIVFIHGEGAAQKVERLYTGFKPGDTHFVGNHLIAAPDGWIYADMGGGANVTTPDGAKKLANITSGLFRFQPDGSAIEQVSSKGGNGFGADVTSDGELFFGQATSGNPIQHVALPEKTLALGKVGSEGGAQSVIKGRKVVRAQLPDRIPLMQIDVVGGYSAACGSLVYEGGAWPAAWDRGLFCTEPILNIIHHEALRPAGATYLGEMVRPEAEFLYSPDYWFRPIEVTTGPDGALYILDFYNPVIAHSDTRGPLHSKAGASVRPDREHYFGRIYRVQNKEARVLPAMDLTALAPAELAKALTNPNRVVRSNALSLLVEKGGPEITAALRPMATSEPFVPARILSLWALQRLGELPPETLKAAFKAEDTTIRKTAALIAEAAGGNGILPELTAGLRETEPRTRIAMLRGLAASKLDGPSATALVALFPELTDDLTKSAAVAAAASSPVAVIQAALQVKNPAAVQTLVSNVAARMVEQEAADAFSELLPPLASAPAGADDLKRLVLEAAARVKGRPHEVTAPPLRTLLQSANPVVAAAALPLAVRWDEGGALKGEVQQMVSQLLAELSAPLALEPRRVQIVGSLVGAHEVSPAIWPALRTLLAAPGTSEGLKRATVAAFGTTEKASAGEILADLFSELPAGVQQSAFDLILTRPAWTKALLGAIEAQKVKPATLGPANLFRLRSHPSKNLALRATEVLNKFGQPNSDKEKVIAQLAPVITQPGNAAHGKELFTTTCAICHKLGDLGKEVGPVLTGIGAHGPEELLVAIVDPNRQIDAGFELFNVETTDGQVQSGILAQENEARLVLRSPAGDVEVPKAKIKSSVNTHRSLMPEGFEALGGENLRDILAFIRGGEARYRVLDLTPAFTADTRRGLYQSAEALHDTLEFRKFGIVNVEGVPFNVVNPENSLAGGNVIVLRGGPPEAFAHSLPNRVEVKVGVPVKAFVFLGGVAGWGASKPDPDGRPVMKVTVRFAEGAPEVTTLHNGVEFGDYVRDVDLPGSRFAEGVVKNRQVRWFTVPVKGRGVVSGLTLESSGDGPAATTVAITADLGGDIHP